MGYVGVSRNDWYIPQIAMLIHVHREADDSEMDGLFFPPRFSEKLLFSQEVKDASGHVDRCLARTGHHLEKGTFHDTLPTFADRANLCRVRVVCCNMLELAKL